jgi:glycogen debranching enzyme
MIACSVSGVRLFPTLLYCLSLGLLAPAATCLASPPDDVSDRLAIRTESVGPQHFLAVHGRRSLIQGYTGAGLEVWAYPFQILQGYRPAFREKGSTSLIDASTLLRSIRYAPDTIVRTYVGQDFVVRETLFVPRDKPAAFITYSVEGPKPIEIAVGFDPVLDLMWPASIGGQSAKWDAKASSYLLFEPSQRFSAFVGSPDIDTHDTPVNSTMRGSDHGHLAFALTTRDDAGQRTATVAMGMLDGANANAATTLKRLLADKPGMERDAKAHDAALAGSQLRIVTPDVAVNDALAWAAVALDQSWVCNPYLGCGVIAGYGPSRDARRPQYEWFFAGDGMIAADAMVATGQYERAKEELAFILKYRDTATGMIWHEMSQSASFVDWNKSYPYMFVHVDTSFQFLDSVARYATASGDKAFVTEHWASLQAAYDYCRTLVNATDGLPRIPAGKEGHNEQDRLADELSLSVSWMNAAQSFARLARLTGHDGEAQQAERTSEKARESMASRYWDASRHDWIDAYSISGKPVRANGSGGIGLVDNHVLAATENDGVLDRIAAADFQSDWGTRSIASTSSLADPSSYAKGSVSAIHTARIAEAYWRAHRPFTAFPLWNALIAWNTLDSPGHIHELTAGDVYHQQTESVPEQTWSSAALLSSAADGLLGLRVEAAENRLTFAPHLPPAWNTLAVDHVRLPGGNIDMSLARVDGGIELVVDNHGTPFDLRFSPAIPLGAHLGEVSVDSRPVKATQESHDQDTHAVVDLPVGKGKQRVLMHYRGGVEVGVPRIAPMPGDRSVGAKIVDVRYRDARLSIVADVPNAKDATLNLRTRENIVEVKGASLRPVSDGLFDLAVPARITGNDPSYRRVEITVSMTRQTD